jgi:hypothetical protein
MKIERIITLFDRNSESHVCDINIDSVDLETLKRIFHPDDDDPLMYNVYPITEKEANELKPFIDLNYEFDKFYYYVECQQLPPYDFGVRSIQNDIKIERIISWYDKDSEFPVSRRNINIIDLEILKNIFLPDDKDPSMYLAYLINEKEAIELRKLVDIDFEFDKYYYQLECYQAPPYD